MFLRTTLLKPSLARQIFLTQSVSPLQFQMQPFSTQKPGSNPTLFEEIGGKPAVEAVVEIFYTKVQTDESLSPMFAETNMKKQKRHMTRFITMAFGGPNLYTGGAMRKVHEKVNFGEHPTEDHFGAVSGHLVSTLKELDVTESHIDEVVGVVMTVKDDVLGK